MAPTLTSSTHSTIPFAVKSLKSDGAFAGYASVFGVRDSQGDTVRRGAFQRSLAQGALPKLLWQHRPEEIIGHITRAAEDAYGLYMEAQLLLEIPRAREVYALLKAGAVDSLSIGYEVVQASTDSERRRVLDEVRLWEISLVTFPANTAAKITAVKARGAWEAVMEALRQAAGILQPRPHFARTAPCQGASPMVFG